MKSWFLLLLPLILIGCSPKISCNSFSLRMAADENAVIDQKLYELVKIKSSKDAPPEEIWVLRLPDFDGRDLEKAQMTKQPPLPPELLKALKSLRTPFEESSINPEILEITIKLKDEAKNRLSKVTSSNVGRKMAMILDGQAIMAPVIREPLNDVEFKITGSFTAEEANKIAARLNEISQCK